VDEKLNKNKLLRYLFPVVLVTISLYVCFKNYTPGTFLTGWDTLHPEFNYKIYWNRILSGAWQSHQGLGAVSSQAHASEIPRIILISVLDIFFATNLIRYLYAFFMLVAGPLGVYFFLKKIILKDFDEKFSCFGSFIGGLFYLLNLGTLQHFNVPLEMFLTHYGLLGWIFLFLTKFYLDGERKDLLTFILASFLIIPQAHTPTLFYVYFMLITAYLFVLVTNKSSPKIGIRRGLTLLLVTLTVNSFWLLPNVYYGITRGKEVPLSKIHHLFSEEAFLVNKKYGNIKDISILRSFLFDWGVFDGENSYVNLLGPWNSSIKKPLVVSIGYLMFLFVLTGLVISIKERSIYSVPWAVLGFISVFFIMGTNPPFGFIFKLMQNHIPLFKELFRFAFTKFSITLMLVYSVFLSYFIAFVTSKLNKRLFGILSFIPVLLATSGIIYFSRPAFRGYLINPAMRVDIPDRYFEMFDYFNEQTEYGRVVDLPIHTFWGWVSYSWNPPKAGYQGAGFLWFGIKQPLLDREFDRWNIANEQAYRELSTAIYSEDPFLLQKTLEKYKVRWLVLDMSVVAPGLNKKVLFYDQIEKLFKGIPEISLDKDFGGGLYVYKYVPQENYSRLEEVNSYYTIGNSLFKEYLDPIYLEYGNYISGGNNSYQFVGFSSVDENINENLIFSDEKKIYFKLPNDKGSISTIQAISVNLILKSAPTGKYVDVLFEETSIAKISLPNIDLSNVFIKINDDVFSLYDIGENGLVGSVLLSLQDKIRFGVYKAVESTQLGNFLYSRLENCDPIEAGKSASYGLSHSDDGFEISARDTIACVTVPLKDVVANISSDLVLVSFKLEKDISPDDFCMLDEVTGLCTDIFLSNGTFLSKLEKGIQDYSLRFYADARNSSTELRKKYFEVNVNNIGLVYENQISIENVGSLGLGSYLTFPKNDQLTIETKAIVGNRRSCKRGVDISDLNFVESDKGIIFNSTKGSLCDSYNFPLASHNVGYVLEVKAKHYEGVPLRICLTNEYSKRCDIEVSLPNNKTEGTYFYIIPPMGNGLGYTVNVSNYVFGDTMSKNELQYVSLIPISYSLVKNIKTNEPTNTMDSNLYILNEAYDPGWVALCGYRVCNANHIKVNNWANGWVFNNQVSGNIRVFFWPQLLEYIGFVLLATILVFSFRYKEKREIVVQPHSVDKS